MIGIDPNPYSLRELDWMATGSGRFRWTMCGSLLAMLFNINRSRTAQPKTADDFNPFVPKRKVKLSPEKSAELLKAVFLAHSNGGKNK